jgi:Protein of unknown function (DUF1616)
MRGHRDLELVVLGAALSALIALLMPLEEVRLIGALPLTLAFPGYAIVAVTFARRPLEMAHRLLLSLAVSLMVLALGGLLLNYGPGGIRSVTWAVLLFGVVLAASRGAALRRPRAAGRRALPDQPVSMAQGGLIAGALAATAAALALAFVTLPADDASGYSELWMLPGDDGRTGLEIGVRSQEQDPVGYQLRINFADGLRPAVTRFSLDPGETHLIALSPVGEAGSEPIPVTASLFRKSRPGDVYRRVTGFAVPLEGAR